MCFSFASHASALLYHLCNRRSFSNDYHRIRLHNYSSGACSGVLLAVNKFHRLLFGFTVTVGIALGLCFLMRLNNAANYTYARRKRRGTIYTPDMSKSMHISSINDLLIVCTVLLFLTWTSDFILYRPIAGKLPRAVNRHLSKHLCSGLCRMPNGCLCVVAVIGLIDRFLGLRPTLVQAVDQRLAAHANVNTE